MSKNKVVQIETKLRSVENMLQSHPKMVLFFKFDKEMAELYPLKIVL